MIKTKTKPTTKIGLNRDTLRKLNAGELTKAQGGYFNSSATRCVCSSGFGQTTVGATACIDSEGCEGV